jgi:hypothetical protein
MKLGEMITEEKKVRCSGCGIVIVVTPHPTNPTEVVTSIPKKREKSKGMTDGQKKLALSGALLGLALLIGIGIWLTASGGGSQLRAAAEGDITHDGAPLEQGSIQFEPTDTSKGAATVTVPIERGHFKVASSRGPFIGLNRVRIFGAAAQLNDSKDLVNIQAGTNKCTYAIASQ